MAKRKQRYFCETCYEDKKAVLRCPECGNAWCKKCAEEYAIYENDHCDCLPTIETC